VGWGLGKVSFLWFFFFWGFFWKPPPLLPPPRREEGGDKLLPPPRREEGGGGVKSKIKSLLQHLWCSRETSLAQIKNEIKTKILSLSLPPTPAQGGQWGWGGGKGVSAEPGGTKPQARRQWVVYLPATPGELNYFLPPPPPPIPPLFSPGSSSLVPGPPPLGLGGGGGAGGKEGWGGGGVLPWVFSILENLTTVVGWIYNPVKRFTRLWRRRWV